MSTSAKTTVMGKLMEIDREGLLSDLKLSLAHECRRVGTRPDHHWREVELQVSKLNDPANISDCAAFASDCFGPTASEFVVAAGSEFIPDKWTDIALKLIDEYYERITKPAVEKPIDVELQPKRRRIW